MFAETTPTPIRPRRAIHEVRDTSVFIDVGGSSCMGSANEINGDCYFAADLRRALNLGPSSLGFRDGTQWFGNRQAKLLAVADGIAHRANNHLASSLVLRAFARNITACAPWFENLDGADYEPFKKAVKEALIRSQEEILAAADQAGAREALLATSFVGAYIQWPHALVAHVGDCRALLFRRGRLLGLTTDDTLAQQLIDRSVVSRDEAEEVPFAGVLTNSIGGSSSDLQIEIKRYALEIGDQLLLCSDGLFGAIEQTEIARTLMHSDLASSATRRLIEQAQDSGYKDDVTAVLAKLYAS